MYGQELYHHGILGQRWGIRRYQPYPKGSGRKGKFLGKVRDKVKKKQVQKKRSKALQKARETKVANAKLAADKERVLKSGSAKELKKYKGKLTNDELRTAITRLELEKKVSEFAAAESNRYMKKVNKVMKDIDQVSNWVNTGTKVYNQIADFYNVTSEGQKNPLKKIGGGGGGNKKKKKGGG